MMAFTFFSCSTPDKVERVPKITEKIKDKWYKCQKDSECVLIVEKQCGHYISLNRKYRSDYLQYLTEQGLPFECRKRWRKRPESYCNLVSNTCRMDYAK